MNEIVRTIVKAAGTGMALLLLLAITVYYWRVLSHPPTAVPPSRELVVVETREVTPSTFLELPVVSTLPTNLFFGQHIQLIQYDIEEINGWLVLRLHWVSQADWPEWLHISVVLQDDEGQEIQAGRILSEGGGVDSVTLSPRNPFPPTPLGIAPVSPCHLLISLYDGETRQQLPVKAEDSSMVVEDGQTARLSEWECQPERTPVVVDLTEETERGLVQSVNAMRDDGSLHLLSYERLIIGGEVGIALTWEVLDQPSSLETFILIKHGKDFMLPLMAIELTDSHIPTGGEIHPSKEWEVGETVTQYFLLRLSPGLSPDVLPDDGRYQIVFSAGFPCPEVRVEMSTATATAIAQLGEVKPEPSFCPMGIDGVDVIDGQILASHSSWLWGTETALAIPIEDLMELTLYEAPDNHVISSSLLSLPSSADLTTYVARIFSGRGLLEVIETSTGKTVAEGWIDHETYDSLLRFGVRVDPVIEEDQVGVEMRSILPEPGSHLIMSEPTLFTIDMITSSSYGMGWVLADVILAVPLDGQLYWVASQTKRMPIYHIDLTVATEKLAKLPQDTGELVLIMQLRGSGESRPYAFFYQPGEYWWTYER